MCEDYPYDKTVPIGNVYVNPKDIYPKVITLDDYEMDVYEIRRRNIKKLMVDRFDPEHGSQKRFADAIDRQPGYVSRCLKKKKRIGEALARHIEESLSLAHGWLDIDHSAHANDTNITINEDNGDYRPLSPEAQEIKKLLQEIQGYSLPELKKVVKIKKAMDDD